MTKLLAMAIRSYDECGDGIFTSAGFALAIMKLLGADEPPDGRVCVRVLESRVDVSRLPGGGNWKWEMWG